MLTDLLTNTSIALEWIVTSIFIAFVWFVMKAKRETKIVLVVTALCVASATTYVLYKQNENNNPLNLPGCSVEDSGTVERAGKTQNFVRLNCGSGDIKYFETHN